MAVSVFDLFKIGIGPSSSHTVGPMRAANLFIGQIVSHDLVERTDSVFTELYGSLSHTGRGHGTDKAIILGLSGHLPDAIDPDVIPGILQQVNDDKSIQANDELALKFIEKKHLKFHKRKTLPLHSNGMQFTALDKDGNELLRKAYYSVGGGFIMAHTHMAKQHIMEDDTDLPHPFTTGEELLVQCKTHGKSTAEIMYANELTWRTREEIDQELDTIWQAMADCVKRGLNTDGVLPGGLKVARRAPKLYQQLKDNPKASLTDPLIILDWVNMFALAVSEENAAGGRVVTAPTNGAAGIIPAVLHYYTHFVPNQNPQGIRNFLLTAAAVGILYKTKASISGAEVGCQGEVGVASSMAAAGLASACDLSDEEVQNAAEIAMEHNLGLTCDPIGGLVQIPCIERNAMGAVKSINATRMADNNDGTHWVSLDKVIRTMKATGDDMKEIYKETSRGGLAVNIIEC
ncbi:L-serine ammonia-lyase [Marinicella rhabdoformis]|uniref:L-serine ammonia-lyase n=1 Tax=Marinicella rhabdoformis TaxID=2580566 RepID=UPI0012AECFA4|nr:L-serine ammonia-lyase [Marinicella rhabdoformis]